MSISIYYMAIRDRSLDEAEVRGLAAIAKKYSVHRLIADYLRTGEGLNWSDFDLHDPRCSPGAVIEGATALPDNTDDASWVGIQHWCAALSELRRLIPDAEWHVRVEDHDIEWDEAQQAYDPTR